MSARGGRGASAAGPRRATRLNPRAAARSRRCGAACAARRAGRCRRGARGGRHLPDAVARHRAALERREQVRLAGGVAAADLLPPLEQRERLASSGSTASLPPLPTSGRMWTVPCFQSTSRRCRPQTSETRRPARCISSSIARSRSPVGAARLAAPSAPRPRRRSGRLRELAAGHRGRLSGWG
jgi:hypothetical protein